jgi:hypothetical protein
MASAELSRRVERVVAYPPLCEMGEYQRREFHEALLDAHAFEDLPGKWKAAVLGAEQSQPNPRIVGSSATRSHWSSRASVTGAPEWINSPGGPHHESARHRNKGVCPVRLEG